MFPSNLVVEIYFPKDLVLGYRTSGGWLHDEVRVHMSGTSALISICSREIKWFLLW